MLEGIVADLIVKYLGEFIEGINKQSLRMDAWEGETVLKNLQIKPGALHLFNIPATVVSGCISKITVKVLFFSPRGMLPQPLLKLAGAMAQTAERACGIGGG